MRVKFKMNLGSIDADKLGLDYRECQCGMTCEVCEEVGEKLVSGNIARPVVSDDIKAVPDKPAIAEAKAPEITSESIKQAEQPRAIQQPKSNHKRHPRK
jgi:hypothetical protein